LNIDHWVGSVGLGVSGCGERFIDLPAISAMIGRFDEDDFCVFPSFSLDSAPAENVLKPWLSAQDPMLALVHGDPLSEENPAHTVERFETLLGGFVVGGLSSSRQVNLQFSDEVTEGGLSGVVFSQNVRVATTLSQGCTPIGPSHTVTRCDDHTVLELDEKKAVEVFEQDLRSFAIKKIDRDPDEILIDESALGDPAAVPEEFQSLMKGEIHAALPISESDQKDYLVRNIMGLDQDEGSMMIAEHVTKGDRLLFVHRDHDSVYEDLSKSLLELRKRVEADEGIFAPKGAIYISCVARAFSDPGLSENNNKHDEVELIQDILGDVPLTGFYAGGEINKARLYGYTGILVLFL
jgi:small ligand-binding sensory domain FIST